MISLTERQKTVLQTIAEHLETHGFPPTLREIGARMKIRSTNGVTDHLRALERKGMIELAGAAVSRGIRLTSGARTVLAGRAHVFETKAPPTPSLTQAEHAVVLAADRWLDSQGPGAEDDLVTAIETLRAVRRASSGVGETGRAA